MLLRSAVLVSAILWAGSSAADSCHQMSSDQLTRLTAKGVTLQLGGQGQGYAGSLKLKKDGTAKGSATMDSGDKFTIAGKWHIAGDKFCRTWEGGRNPGQEICETWCITSGHSVEVFNGKEKLGVNSW